MREIKYRMWNKKEKKMYQVGVLDFDYNQIYMTGYLNYTKSSYLYEDIELMQFTGLYDKNGKEIYESDIVQIDKDVAKTFDIYSKGIINYLNGGFIVTKNDGSYETIRSALLVLGDLNNIFRGKVIGNIYENPELLKGADNIEL